MSKENNKINKKTLLRNLLLIGVLLVVLLCVVIPRIMDLRRRINIAKDLESVYTEAEIVKVVCDMEPISKAELQEDYYLWFGPEPPEDDLYVFYIVGKEDECLGKGYATKDGTVIYDTYARKYYADEAVLYFEGVVDFEHNFPGMKYYIAKKCPEQRIVLTHDCTTFEGYKRAGAVGYGFVGFAGGVSRTGGWL